MLDQHFELRLAVHHHQLLLEVHRAGTHRQPLKRRHHDLGGNAPEPLVDAGVLAGGLPHLIHPPCLDQEARPHQHRTGGTEDRPEGGRGGPGPGQGRGGQPDQRRQYREQVPGAPLETPVRPGGDDGGAEEGSRHPQEPFPGRPRPSKERQDHEWRRGEEAGDHCSACGDPHARRRTDNGPGYDHGNGSIAGTRSDEDRGEQEREPRGHADGDRRGIEGVEIRRGELVVGVAQLLAEPSRPTARRRVRNTAHPRGDKILAFPPERTSHQAGVDKPQARRG